MRQVLLMHAAEDPQEVAQPRARALAAVAVDFSHAIPVIVTRPLAPPPPRLSMPDSGVAQCRSRFHFGVASPLIRVQDTGRLLGGGSDHRQAGRAVGVVMDEVAHQPALAPLDRKDRRAVCLISSVPAPLVGASSWRVSGVAMRIAFFPRRSGTTRRLRARRQAAARRAVFAGGCAVLAAAVHARAHAPAPTRARSEEHTSE